MERPVTRGAVPLVTAAAVAGLLGGMGGSAVTVAVLGDGRGTGSSASASGASGTDGTGSDGTSSTAATQAAGSAMSISQLSRAVLPSVALISLGEDGSTGQGSGFVIRQDGYILTNHHVATAGGRGGAVTVELPGREPLPATLVGSDPAYDIAVLKVQASGLAALPFAPEGSVEVGQTVVAVGAPLGLGSTVTSGIVSAMNRPVVTGEETDASYISAIQTDAAINPGNSGGPLLDLQGRVVGVNSAIAQIPNATDTPSGSIGLGFAIPAVQASRTATQLIQSGHSEHPIMGVQIDTTYTGDGAQVLPQPRDGALPVVPGGPADRAGVRPGDVIVAIDGTRVTDMKHLLVLLRAHAVGDTVRVTLRGQDDRERTVSITLAGSGD